MEAAEKVEAYYEKDHHFKVGMAVLRDLALKTELEETFKWSAPVYTLNNKNVLLIWAFKNHFGIGFFNGVFLKDPLKILENAQEGKTKAMRHWKFTSNDAIDKNAVTAYILEAIENQKKGLAIKPERKQGAVVIPDLLKEALNKESSYKSSFEALTPGKQREYCEYISTAKQEKTKLSRLEKIKPLILEGVGLNDKYKNC